MTKSEDEGGVSQTERRTRIAADIVENTGIDEELIRKLVHEFYARVREDDILAPIFDHHISDWTSHLEKMCAFWSSVALMTGRYHGRPMEKHLPLPVDARHFDRWLALFEETAKQECSPAAAEHFIERARRIAESLEMGIASNSGVLLGKGERYVRGKATPETAEQEKSPWPMKIEKLRNMHRRHVQCMRQTPNIPDWARLL